MSRASSGLAVAGIAAMAMALPRTVQTGGSYSGGALESWRRKPAAYVPNQDRKPRGVDRAAKRAARKKATAWRGK